MKLELTNQELEFLLQEINDAIPKIEPKGGQPLRFLLTVLSQNVDKLLSPFNTLKKELITTKGIAKEGGNYELKQFNEDGTQSEEFKELIELYSQKLEIDFKLIPLSYFEKLNSEKIYLILPKFVEI
jgi:hypothetical protein